MLKTTLSFSNEKKNSEGEQKIWTYFCKEGACNAASVCVALGTFHLHRQGVGCCTVSFWPAPLFRTLKNNYRIPTTGPSFLQLQQKVEMLLEPTEHAQTNKLVPDQIRRIHALGYWSAETGIIVISLARVLTWARSVVTVDELSGLSVAFSASVVCGRVVALSLPHPDPGPTAHVTRLPRKPRTPVPMDWKYNKRKQALK